VTGSNRLSLQEIVAGLFAWAPPAESRDLLMELFRWHAMDLGGRGTVSLLDARGADERVQPKIGDELKEYPADMVLYLADDHSDSRDESELDNLGNFLAAAPPEHPRPKVLGILWGHVDTRLVAHHASGQRVSSLEKIRSELQKQPSIAPHLLQVIEMRGADDAPRFMTLLARNLPNEARVEMARIAHDRVAQTEIAQTLVKSTTAICAAIGAQPIPLADLPILTALQLMMVSGVMYISGRERSLRAATEFVTALGVNVGAGMILREGARALLKFFPGWGNVVCGAVAGAGTYAIGRAAIVYFLEGLTLKDARRAYLSSRRKRKPPEPRPIKQIQAAS
jgi:uncharacterized protein (DUF697 family)